MVQLVEKYIPKMIDFMREGKEGGGKVVINESKKELYEILDLKFENRRIGSKELETVIEKLFKYSINPYNAKFCDKLYSGSNPIGVLSEWLLTFLNANSHVYHVSPVLTQIELFTSRELAKLYGFNDKFSGGLTFPGGSTSNLMALVTCRNLWYPHIKFNGYTEKDKLSIFTSDKSHYSIQKSAMSIGIGLNRVYKVKTKIEGTMDIEDLINKIEYSISLGETPLFLNITAGTTVQGFFEDIIELCKVAKKYQLWAHLDASWGGPVIFSEKYKHLLNGSEMVDSITMNPHKLLGVPLQCSFLLLKDRTQFVKANSLDADYLFHNSSLKENDDNLDWLEHQSDLGQGTIACGRKPDAFKMYLAWKYYGKIEFENRVNVAFDNICYLKQKILNHPRFQLAFNPNSVNCCFWYIPLSYTKQFAYLSEDNLISNEVVPKAYGIATIDIHKKLRENGEFMIDYSPLDINTDNGLITLPPFFRMVSHNPNLNPNHMDQLIELILYYASDLKL
ncbi:PLP-dependent transferase [Neoconidiobolus thromboides FSU 785]|nr:PLP-dependent transferase [Neoconidiobolus thromboides FSU 785]